jgi:hypothetical protein
MSQGYFSRLPSFTPKTQQRFCKFGSAMEAQQNDMIYKSGATHLS